MAFCSPCSTANRPNGKKAVLTFCTSQSLLLLEYSAQSTKTKWRECSWIIYSQVIFNSNDTTRERCIPISILHTFPLLVFRFLPLLSCPSNCSSSTSALGPSIIIIYSVCAVSGGREVERDKRKRLSPLAAKRMKCATGQMNGWDRAWSRRRTVNAAAAAPAAGTDNKAIVSCKFKYVRMCSCWAKIQLSSTVFHLKT